MGKIVESRGLYEYISNNGIVYEIGMNGAEFNIIIDTFIDYDDKFIEWGPFNFHLVDYVMGELDDSELIDWLDKRIERYENHERILRFYNHEPCECYIGLKEEKHDTRKRVLKEELFIKK